MEFALLWNWTVINCTTADVHSPSEWANGAIDYGPGVITDYNSTTWMGIEKRSGFNSTFNGIYFKGQTYEYPEATFNGSIVVVTLTFQALQPGETSLSLKDTILGNSSAVAILHTDSDGFVDVLDMVAFANCFGLRQGNLGWSPDADVNGDDKINILDAIMIGQKSGTGGSQSLFPSASTR